MGGVGGALEIDDADAPWRWSLIVGLALSPLIARAPWGAVAPVFASHWPTLIVSGLLAGFGAGLGSGCASGHGACGLARLSPRSFAATGVFMAAAFGAVFVARHLVG